MTFSLPGGCVPKGYRVPSEPTGRSIRCRRDTATRSGPLPAVHLPEGGSCCGGESEGEMPWV